MRLSNLQIGLRMGLGFGGVLTLLVALALANAWSISKINSALEKITLENGPEAKLASAMRLTVYSRALALRNLALITDVEEMKPEVERLRTAEKKYSDAEARLNAMFAALPGTTDEEKSLMKKIKEIETSITPYLGQAESLGLKNKAEEARDLLLTQIRPLQGRWLESLGELIDLEERLSLKLEADANKEYARAIWLSLVLTTLAVVVGAAAGWWTTRSVVRPIKEAVTVAAAVAAGDLTAEIEVRSSDETGVLMQALKEMNEGLLLIVSDVRSGVDSISTGASQIANGNSDLASRTEEQASSLEETASAMEELTSTVRQSADNASTASLLAVAASENAAKGGAVVSEVVQTMAAIEKASKKISDIITLIDGIAFQTNILALNAAVEAARAGEQGRGFAVVASEVRGLAQRSAAAAKEIKVLIETTAGQVDEGVKLVTRAGLTMEEIVTSVKQVTDIMGEISAATHEQSRGIEQINEAIMQMDRVTQQNSALVEEAAAASEAMSDQAAKVAEAVQAFKVQSSLLKVSSGTRPHTASRGIDSPPGGQMVALASGKRLKLVAPLEQRSA